MPRQYIVNSWVGAAEYDEGDTYNGQQVGNRNQKSIGVHVTRSGDQWYANTAAYAEPEKKAPAKKKTAFHSISLADSNYERLCGLSDALDTQLDNGELSFEDWTYARRQIDERLAKAWSRLCKARNWDENGESLDNHPEHELTFSLEDIEESSFHWEKQRVKRELTGNDIFDSLSETNVFLGLFIKVKKLLKFIETIKQQF